jgi:hypothetical protein
MNGVQKLSKGEKGFVPSFPLTLHEIFQWGLFPMIYLTLFLVQYEWVGQSGNSSSEAGPEHCHDPRPHCRRLHLMQRPQDHRQPL